MSTKTHTEPASLTSELGATTHSSNTKQDSKQPDLTQPKPWILRPWVRATIYLFLALFLLGMLSWGIVPRLLDPTFEKHIQNKEVIVGMTREQVMEAWGSPYQTNISHTSEGIRREKWIYEDWVSAGEVKHRYLYFEEGILVGGWR